MNRRLSVLGLFFLAALLFLWEWGSRTNPALAVVFPPPSKICESIRQSYSILFHEALVTIKGMIGGFLVALGFAFSFAIVMDRFKESKSFFQPIFVALQCLPLFTLAPLIVLWFGWGLQAVIIPNALMIFFPLTLTICQGLKSSPNELEEFFDIHRATYNQTLIKLRLPFAIPHIFSGLKIAAAGAGFGAIASEWVAGTSGLGILILETRRNYELEMTFGALFTLSVLTISFYSLILYLEKVFFRAFRITKPKKISSKKKSTPKHVLTGLTITLATMGGWIYVKQNKNEELSKVGLQKTELLLDWLPNANHIPFYVGKEKKFFEDRKIDLSIRKCIDGGNTLPHLLFQKTDLIIQSTTGTIKAYLKGSPVQIIGQLIKLPLSGLIYRESDIKINDISELNGKIFGLYFNSQDPSVFLNTLKKHGVVPKHVKNVSADLISSMVLKKIDVLYGAFWNIEGIKLESLGLKLKVFPPSSYGVPDAPQMIIVAKQKTVFAEKHFVFSFREALNESIDFCIHNPEESLRIFFKYVPQNEKIRKNTALQWGKTLPLFAKQDKIDDQMLSEVCDWLTKNNSLKGFSKGCFPIDLEPF